ncbi:hypothetical protein I317_03810 [Kwoniella heveanensis CBS 569]|nr:hypothetical protein I317_03810 [Kwoniella heveanensis CBS 569]
MPSQFSSPPLRAPRSPGGRSPVPIHSQAYAIETPPLPQWEMLTSPYTSMTRSNRHVLSPHRAAPAPPVPPLPSSPAMYGTAGSPLPSPAMISSSSPIVRSTSSSSSASTASSSSTTSQRVSTPPPPIRNRRASKTSSKLLPALPLSINTGSDPLLSLSSSPAPSPASAKSKRLAVDYSASGATEGLGIRIPDDVQIVVSREGRRSRAVSVSMGSSPCSTPVPKLDMSCLPTPPITSSHSPSVERAISRSPNRQLITPLAVVGATPPRPARRASSVYPSPASTSLSTAKKSPLLAPRPISLAPHSDLLPPPNTYARSLSPSGESISTITVSPASTPRPVVSEVNSSKPANTIPDSSSALALAIDDFSTPMGGRKRDSAQRRLSALRGLVANLDFNQPWSITDINSEENLFSPEPQLDSDQGSFIWACGGDSEDSHESDQSTEESFIMTSSSEEALSSPVHQISLPLPFVREDQHKGIIEPDIAESHGWPEPKSIPHHEPEPLSASAIEYSPLRADVASVRQNPGPRKQSSSTPPRRPRPFRASSDLLSRTPEPPRPASRARREVFDVASSGYSKCFEPASPLLPVTPTSTWRSSLATDETYSRLMQTYGPMEVKRQEIIWEMCETEHAFIKSMRTVLRLFATPLKTPQGRWIDGIPGKITDLFDSLECIVHAHGIVSTSERDMRRRSDVLDVSAFVGMFKGWVHRLEVHEWYLIKFESVVALVEENVRDPDSVFGEFVRMQMKEEVLGAMSLGSMLLKPVQRLTKYPLFLKRLLDATPHPHHAHPEILALLSTTESIILTLQATKAKEEDFEQLQAFEPRLIGLPEGFSLVVRGRKLLGQGQVLRVPPSKDLSAVLGSRARAGSLHSSRGSISSSFSSSAPSTASSISPWDFSASLTPSRTSAFSVSSNGSSLYSGPPSRSNSITKPSPSFSAISSFSSPSRPSVTRSPSSTSSFVDSPRPSTPSSSKGKRKEDVLTMLIFDDLVILGSVVQERGGLFGVTSGKKKGQSMLRVLPESEGGIGKVAEIKDWSGWNGHSNLLIVTILPISHSARKPMAPITTAFSLPNPSLSTSPSLRSLKPSLSSNSLSNGLNLTCPTLNSLSGFLGMLGQVSTAGMGVARGSEYVDGDQSERYEEAKLHSQVGSHDYEHDLDEKEILEEEEDDSDSEKESSHVVEGEWTGYAT